MATLNGFKVKNKWFHEWVHTADLPLTSGDRDVILKWLWDSNLIPWYVTYTLERYIDDEYVQDCIGELWLIICEVKQEKWDYLFHQGKMCVSAYVTGIIRQQCVSSNSRLYKLYDKYNSMEINKDDDFWYRYEED